MDLDEIYESQYSYSSHSLVGYEKRKRAKKLFNLIAKYCEIGQVLEFGSGEGHLLAEARKRGIYSVGIEISGKLSTGRSSKENIVKISAEDFLAKAGALTGTIIMSHTFEHFQRPHYVLEQLQEKLDAKANVVLVVPNIKNRFGKIRGRYWGYWQVPVHIYHFYDTTLEMLLKSYGFSRVKSFTRSGDFLSKGLYISNLLRLKSSQVSGNQYLNLLVKLASYLWSFSYRYGSSDLIMFFTRD